MFRLLIATVSVTLCAGISMAQTCGSYTYTFGSGTTAVASQVNANFTSILNCANNNLAPLVSPNFTQQINLTSAVQGTPLSVTGSVNDVGLQLKDTATGGHAYAFFSSGGSSGFGQGVFSFYDSTAGATRLTITNAGYVGVATSGPTIPFYVNGAAGGTTSWNGTSDLRLKKNIVQISDALNMVKKLRGVRFQWKEPGEREVGKKLALPTGEKQIGFIAQEVESIVPEVVTPSKTGVADSIYSLRETDLIPVLVEAMKEQQSEIEALKTEIAVLKSAKAPAH